MANVSTKASSPLADGLTNAGENTHLHYAEVLDQDVLHTLENQIGKDNLQTVLSKVTTEVGQLWEELLAAQISHDKVATQRHTHSLASIFRSVGLIPAGEALGELETDLRQGRPLASGWIEDFDHIRTSSILALAEYLESMSSSESKTSAVQTSTL